MTNNHHNHTYSETDVDLSTKLALDEYYIPPGWLMVAHEKLTRKFLNWLPTGVIIHSGCLKFDLVDGEMSCGLRFTGLVGDATTRAATWIKIRESGADQRNCFIFAAPSVIGSMKTAIK
ncbi:MAG: hypothetical protein QM796_10845 [Chthoniobacteraceae bacterium]